MGFLMFLFGIVVMMVGLVGPQDQWADYLKAFGIIIAVAGIYVAIFTGRPKGGHRR